jgi:hypothetical protein
MKSRVSPYKTDRALGVDLYLKNNLKKNNYFSRKFLGSDNIGSNFRVGTSVGKTPHCGVNHPILIWSIVIF